MYQHLRNLIIDGLNYIALLNRIFFKEIYKISELDGAIFRNIYINNKLKRFHVDVILDIFNRYRTPISSDDGNNIVNFANIF